MGEKNSRKFSEELAVALTEEFRSGESDEIVLAYNHFVSAISRRMTFERLLPLSAQETDDGGAESSSDYIFEPEKEQIIGSILPKYVQVRIERAMNESLTSEHAARMTAMGKRNQQRGRGDSETYPAFQQDQAGDHYNGAYGYR